MTLTAFDVFKAAKSLPPQHQSTDITIDFTLAEDNFGWANGSRSDGFTGAALDLTGATVKLHGKIFPVAASVADLASGYSTDDFIGLFEAVGTITDALNGKVSVSIPKGDSDAVGTLMAEIEVENATGSYFVPGLIRFDILPKLGNR